MSTAPNSQQNLEGLHHRLNRDLRASLEAQWEEVLGQWKGADPADREAILSEVTAQRDKMLERLLQLDTVKALQRGIALQYIAMKSHWATVHLQLEAQARRGHSVEEMLLYRATCVNLLLQRLEPLLSPASLDTLTATLCDPGIPSGK